MNKKLIGFLSLLFLSLSFTPSEPSIWHVGHYLRVRFPIFNAEIPEHRITLHFVPEITGLFSFAVVIGNEKTKNMSTPFFKRAYAPYNSFLSPIRLQKGHVFTYSFTILQKNLIIGKNLFSIYSNLKSCLTDVFTFTFYSDYPKTWKLPSKKPLGRNTITGGFLKGTRCDGMEEYEIRHQGFCSSFTNPSHSIVPLEKMILTCFDVDGRLVPPTASSITMSIIDSSDSLTFFPKKYVNGKIVREVPLKLVGNGTSRFLTLANGLVVSFDGREIRRSNSDWKSEYQTSHFFLPPVKKGESLSYPVTITFKGIGEANFDTIVYQFSIFKDRNYLGSKGNSDFYVKETE